MKISSSNQRQRDPRYVYDKPVRMQSDNGHDVAVAEGKVHDVSMSGVAVSMDVSLVENGQFINMHIEGLGQVAGNVTRVYEGGAAIAFNEDEETRKRVEAAISGLNQLA